MTTETATTFTRGPWYVAALPNRQQFRIWTTRRDEADCRTFICDVAPDDETEQYIGNAHLIAAAPLMHDAIDAALVDAVALLRRYPGEPHLEAIGYSLSQALAAARGQSPALIFTPRCMTPGGVTE